MFITLSSCDVNEPKKENPKSEGYQEDIPWPSLADSPWPMYHHDPQSSGRSKSDGPQLGEVDWVLSGFYSETGLTIGLNSTLLIATTSNPIKLFKVKSVGEILSYVEFATAGEVLTAPLIASDGTVYIAHGSGIIYAISKDNNVKWIYETNAGVGNQTLNIDLSGNIYYVDNHQRLNVISKEGNLLWSLQNNKFGIGFNQPLFSPNGKTIYIVGHKGVSAVDIDTKEVKWSSDSLISAHSALVDANGLIYLFASSNNIKKLTLFVYDAEGREKWKFSDFNNDQSNYIAEPTIDKYGNIYFGFDTLYSLDYSGKLRWKKSLNGHTETAITSDARGNVFVISIENYSSKKLFSFNSTGDINWMTYLDDSFSFHCPAIGFNKIFIPSFKSSKIFAIK